MRFSTKKLIAGCTLLLCTLTNAIVAQKLAPQEPITVNAASMRHQITVSSPDQPILITGLVPGQVYQMVMANALPNGLGACDPTIVSYIHNIPPASVVEGIAFAASQSSMEFSLMFPCTWNPSNPPVYWVSIHCVTCPVRANENTPDDILVVGDGDATTLIRDVLIGGNCFDLTGMIMEGNAGTFSNGQTNIGFAEGVIIATGGIGNAVGPNNADNASGGGGGGSDSDLASIATGAQFDVSKLEFDFTPTQTPIVFEYVFASEEYCEYVGTGFNDVFGFFISGPGIPGGTQNLATIAGTPITINNVNHITNSGLYVNNQPATSGNLCGQLPSSAPSTQEVQYDGYTRRFTAVANVIPCSTYHIKLAIADVNDGIFDSAVFLKAGSFDAGGNASVEWLVNGDLDDEVTEGCGTVQLRFERVGGNPNIPVNVPYVISGTATPGLDYSPIPGSVVIPGGQMSVTINVNIVVDALLEGPETVIVRLLNPCSCLKPQIELTINDLLPFTALPDTVIVCGNGTALLSASPNGGVEPLAYLWSNGGGVAQEASFSVGAQGGNFRVTITDACGRSVVQNFRVNALPIPSAQLVPPAPQICPGNSEATLTINFNGTGPFTLNYNLNGTPQDPLVDITDDPLLLTINQPGIYQLTGVLDAAGCPGPGQGAMNVQVSTLAVTGEATSVACFGQTTGSINTTVSGGQPAYTYQWAGPQPVPNVADPTNLGAGIYTVTVRDFIGCTVTRTFTILIPNALTPSVASTTIPNCLNPFGGSINLEVQGGTPNYTYLWSNGATVQDPVNLQGNTYTVTVTDQTGCSRTVVVPIVPDIQPPTAVAAVDQPLTCQVTSVTLTGAGSSVGPNYSYTWQGLGGAVVSGNPNAVVTTTGQAGTYQIVVTDAANGCTNTATVTVTTNAAPPVVVINPPQQITCAITNVTIDANGSSSGASQFSYLWTASNGGNIAGGSSTLTPIVDATGTYTLLITNNTTGCTSTGSVAITSNTAQPSVTIPTPQQLTCTNNTVTLTANSSPSNVAFDWTFTSGNIVSGQGTASAVVNAVGFYTVEVTNPLNGCKALASTNVTQNLTLPVAQIDASQALTCAITQVVLNAASSSNGPGFSYNWTASNGGSFVGTPTGLTPAVNAPGLYTLVVTNTNNNCTAVSSVQIDENTTPPAITIGQPTTVNCFQPTAILGDPNAFLLPGTTYQWAASNGGAIQSGNGTPAITVAQAGTYGLTVTNTSTGCTNAASVSVQQDFAAPNASVAAPQQLNCTNQFVQLNGQGSSGPTFGYQWSTSNGVISAGGSTLTPAVTSAGTYTLTVTNNINGCTATASATVVSNVNVPNVTIAAATPLTCNLTQTTLNGSGSSVGANFTYQWGTLNGQILSGANTLTPTVGEPGVYTLVVTNTTNQCTAVQTVTVPDNALPPSAFAGATQTLSCNIPNLVLAGSGSTGAGFTYAWTVTGQGNIVSGANTLTPTINAPGTYQLLVTNTNTGCTAVSGVQIVQDAGQPVVEISDPTPLTCAVTQLQLSSTGSSVGPNYIYAWTGPGIVSGANSNTPTINTTGTYTLQITNTDNGCTQTEQVLVTNDVIPPVADPGPNATLNCFNPVLELGTSNTSTGANFTYVWTGPGIVSGQGTPLPTVDQAGTYSVVVTNTANGCTATAAVLLGSDFNAPTADAGPGGELTCVNNFFQTSPNASTGSQFTYAWTTTTGSFQTSPNQISPILNGEGFYFLTVTNTTNGCTATDQLQVTRSAEFPNAEAGLSGVLNCDVSQLTLDGSGSAQGTNITYLWVPIAGGNIVSGNTSLTPVINAPGTYQIIVQDNSNSCISYSQVIVYQDLTPPAVTAGQDVTLTCSVNTLSLDGDVTSNGNFQYQWTASGGGNILTGANTLAPTINAVGNYQLVVTNTLNGCTATDAVQVLADLNAPVVALATPDTLDCIFGEVTINANGSSTGNVAYIWSTVNGNILNQTNPLQVKVNEPGVYQLLITDLDNNCTSLSAVQVYENKIYPIAEAGSDYSIDCYTAFETLDGSGSSQNGNYYYQWTTATGDILVGDLTLTPTVASPGIYQLTVLNTDNGCFSTDQTLVESNTIEPAVNIVIPAVITCFETEVILDGSNSSSGANYQYAWTTPTGNIVSGANDLQAVVNDEGQYTLTILNTDNGCSNANTTFVSINQVPPSVLILPSPNLTCDFPIVPVNAIAAVGSQYVYGWSTVDGRIVSGASTLNLLVDEPGTYAILIVDNNNGCATFADTYVDEIDNVPTDLEFSVEPPGCRDSDGFISFDTIIGGVGPYLYSIDGGESFSTQEEFGTIQPGDYSLLIEDINGCQWVEDVTVPAAIDPGISLIPDITLNLGDSIKLQAQLAPGFPIELVDTIIWTPLDYLRFEGNSIEDLLSPIATPYHTVRYTVKIISKNGGCEAIDRVFILVDTEPRIYIPNAFYPEDPAQQDHLFMIFADDQRRQIKQINSFQVFDRWGEMVFQDQNFQPNDPVHGWNGRIGGTSAPLTPAVFVYLAIIEMVDGRILQYEGDVTLIR
jgi:Calx-beta domain/SprB repeat/CHU_C Type IX secretion signal domain